MTTLIHTDTLPGLLPWNMLRDHESHLVVCTLTHQTALPLEPVAVSTSIPTFLAIVSPMCWHNNVIIPTELSHQIFLFIVTSPHPTFCTAIPKQWCLYSTILQTKIVLCLSLPICMGRLNLKTALFKHNHHQEVHWLTYFINHMRWRCLLDIHFVWSILIYEITMYDICENYWFKNWWMLFLHKKLFSQKGKFQNLKMDIWWKPHDITFFGNLLCMSCHLYLFPQSFICEILHFHLIDNYL